MADRSSSSLTVAMVAVAIAGRRIGESEGCRGERRKRSDY